MNFVNVYVIVSSTTRLHCIISSPSIYYITILLYSNIPSRRIFHEYSTKDHTFIDVGRLCASHRVLDHAEVEFTVPTHVWY
jgi:hypothetical protein